MIRLAWRIVAICALTAASAACDGASGGGRTDSAPSGEEIPVIVSAQLVCRLVRDNASAGQAQIAGVDGTQSALTTAGTAYWFFGDTIRNRADGTQDVIPASVATSVDMDASDCIDLEFKTRDGVAEPLFPRLDETTAWPDGVLAVDNGAILFYMVKAYRQSPFAWHVGGVGLGRIAPGSLNGTRLVETIWDENSGFGSRVAGVRSPVREGADVMVYIRADAGGNYVARAPLGSIELASEYEYWDGEGWQPEPSKARPMWESEKSQFPPDNGVQVTYDLPSGRWVALYNGDLAWLTVRTALAPWGPWSEPVTWVDCRTFVEDVYPYCYSAELHRHLTRESGRVLYATVSSQRPYDVSLLELHTATPIHEWRRDSVRRYAPSNPSGGWTDAGIAFYASDRPAPRLVPVYEHEGDGAFSYTLDASADARVSFYAHPAPGGTVPLAPVHRWRTDDGDALSAAELDGERGAIVFYVPCAGSRSENTSCPR